MLATFIFRKIITKNVIECVCVVYVCLYLMINYIFPCSFIFYFKLFTYANHFFVSFIIVNYCVFVCVCSTLIGDLQQQEHRRHYWFVCSYYEYKFYV